MLLFVLFVAYAFLNDHKKPYDDNSIEGRVGERNENKSYLTFIMTENKKWFHCKFFLFPSYQKDQQGQIPAFAKAYMAIARLQYTQNCLVLDKNIVSVCLFFRSSVLILQLLDKNIALDYKNTILD